MCCSSSDWFQAVIESEYEARESESQNRRLEELAFHRETQTGARVPDRFVLCM